MNNKVQPSRMFLLPGEAKALRVFIGNRRFVTPSVSVGEVSLDSPPVRPKASDVREGIA